MKRKLKIIGIGLLIIVSILFWGSWLLNLFGITKYEPPTSQSPDSIIQVDFLEAESDGFRVLHTLPAEEIPPFLEAFFNLNARRYANDPPADFWGHTLRICYSDGGFDLLGTIVAFYSASGERLPTNGWYYLDAGDLDELFENYIP